jgi:hypothetical protein
MGDKGENTMTSTAAHLEALRDRASNDYERDAAQRALTRHLEGLAARGASTKTARTWVDTSTYGDKRTPGVHMTTTEIVERMRADLKVAKSGSATAAKAGDVAVVEPLTQAFAKLPKGVRITVMSKWLGGCTTEVNVRLWGSGEAFTAWAWRELTAEERDADGYDRFELSTEAAEICRILRDELVSAYNRDNSDLMTDYFDRDYYGDVQVKTPKGYWNDFSDRLDFNRVG